MESVKFIGNNANKFIFIEKYVLNSNLVRFGNLKCKWWEMGTQDSIFIRESKNNLGKWNDNDGIEENLSIIIPPSLPPSFHIPNWVVNV